MGVSTVSIGLLFLVASRLVWRQEEHGRGEGEV